MKKELKINIPSLYKEFHYGISPNYRYGQRHSNDFTEDYIVELKIYKRGYHIKVEAVYCEPSYGSIERTSLLFNTEGKYIKSNCDCIFHNRYNPCGHVWILAMYLYHNIHPVPYEYIDENADDLEKFREHLLQKIKIRERRKQTNLFIDKMIEEEMKSQRSISDFESVKIVPELYKVGDYNRKFTIRYRIGEDKLYIIKHIKDHLLTPLKNNSYYEYGKNFKTILSNEIFEDFSVKEISFIKDHIDNVQKNELVIDEISIDDFFELHQEESGIDNLKFIEQHFKFELSAEKEEEFYTLKMTSDQSNVECMDENAYHNREFIITDKRFYMLSTINNMNVLFYMDTNKKEALFYSELLHNDIYFTKEELKEVLATFKDHLNHIRIADDVLEDILKEDIIKPILYCDINEEMDLILNIKYKDNRPSIYLKKLLKKLVFSGFNELKELDLNPSYPLDSTYKITKNVIEFIESTLPNLNEDAEVFLSDSIKNYSYARTLNLSVGVKVKHNLLQLEFLSDDIDPKEFYDILKRYKKKKKYYKMKSGEIIKIDKAQIESIDHFLRDMGIEESELKKKNIKIPSYRRFRLSSEHDIDILTDDQFEKLFEKKETKINKKYQKILRDYQKEGVQFMLDLRTMKLGGLLADDMGLGKTLQVIAHIESIEKREKPILIITPSSLILNWESEFDKFQSTVDVRTIHGNKETRREMIETIKNNMTDNVVITSYDYLKRDLYLYEDITFDTVVIDEAQYIKNYKTKAARSVKEIQRDYSIALTGTPIENSLAEIWSVFDFIMPGYLFHYNKFSKHYEKPIVLNEDEKASKSLKLLVEPFILRRLKKDVLKELPEKIEETYYIELNEEEREIYQANLFDINMKLKNSDQSNKIEILSMLTKLRQICIDAGLVYDKVYNQSSKIKATMELIEKAILNKEKILVFSSFTTVLDNIAERCNENGIDYFMLTGSTNKIKRKEYVDRFQSGEGDLFLISLKAGGTGLNLTSASLVIHIDPWWNISAQNQATDRAHRIGQKNTVQVISLIAKDTIEEKIQKMQEKKKELSDTFVEHSEGSFAKLDKEELMSLFT